MWRRLGHRVRGPRLEVGGEHRATDCYNKAGGHFTISIFNHQNWWRIRDFDSRATVLSIDGINVFDMTSRAAMLHGLHQVRGDTALPFVPHDSGDTHVIHRGEKGEQGQPLLCCQDFLFPHQHLFIYFDDLYVGHWLPGCQEMQEVAARVDPQARVWQGEGPPSQQGVRVLGIPIGHEEFVQVKLRATTEKHRLLVERLPSVRDLQSDWLLFFCVSTRATHSFRGVPPAETEHFTAAHDSPTWQCFTQLQGIFGHTKEAFEWAGLPFQMGGCGLRSATRTRALWVSWAQQPQEDPLSSR